MNAECKQMIDECPSMLRMALAMDVIDGELDGETGFPELREVARHCLTGALIAQETIDLCRSKLGAWIETQEELQENAWDLVGQLEELMPTDDLDNMPNWPWSKWGKDLHLPWSEHLGDAVSKASVVVAEKRKRTAQ